MNMRRLITLVESQQMLTESITAYHGSNQDVAHFKHGHTGTNSNAFGSYETTRYGVFFSDNPEFAAMYGKVQKYRLNVSKTLDLDNDNNLVWNLYQSVDAHDPEQRDLWLALKSIVNGSPAWHLFEEELGAFFTKHLIDLGYDSATFEEYGEDDNGTEHRSRTIVVLDPAKITKSADFSKDNPLLQTRPLEEHLRGRSGERAKEEATNILAAEIGVDHPEVRLHAGLDPDGDEDEDATEKDVWDWCNGQILDAAYSVTKNIKGDSIRCWRVITAPEDWNPEAQHPGMYWSWDRSAAEAHWGERKPGYREWEIEADIPVDSVDWVMSMVMNANPEYEEEKEIRIFENAPVNIISIK